MRSKTTKLMLALCLLSSQGDRAAAQEKEDPLKAPSSAGVRALLAPRVGPAGEELPGREPKVEGMRLRVTLDDSTKRAAAVAKLIDSGATIDNEAGGIWSIDFVAGAGTSTALNQLGGFVSIPPVLTGFPTATVSKSAPTLELHGVDSVRPGTKGDGVIVGVWDTGAVLVSHGKFGSRCTQKDSGSVVADHATHCAGVVVGNGVGVAPAAELHAYDMQNDILELLASTAHCTSHAYDSPRGWNWESWLEEEELVSGWRWYGTPGEDPKEDYLFGKYSVRSEAFDKVGYDKQHRTIFVSAGNSRHGSHSGPGKSREPGQEKRLEHQIWNGAEWEVSYDARNKDYATSGGYDTLGGMAVAKNVITVGALNGWVVPLPPKYVVSADYSSWGPADDGRIKPDVVASGAGFESTSSAGQTALTTKAGTSVACSVAAGIGALVWERLRQEMEEDEVPTSDLVKAALIHTAMKETPSPNYRVGWGCIMADRAVALVDGTAGSLSREVLKSGKFELQRKSPAGTPIRVTVVWIDQAGNANGTGRDDSTRSLVDDIDLKVVRKKANGTVDKVFYPWSLDPETPTLEGTRAAPNKVDNVERVDVPATEVSAGSKWKIEVNGKANKDFALAISGLVPE